MTTLAPEKLAEYRAAWQERHTRKRQELLARQARARQVAQAAAGILRTRFGAKRVRLFGSVLTPTIFHTRSDIDLAVEGIDPMQVLKAWCAVSALAPEFEFDLVIPEECRPEIWSSVETEGIDL